MKTMTAMLTRMLLVVVVSLRLRLASQVSHHVTHARPLSQLPVAALVRLEALRHQILDDRSAAYSHLLRWLLATTRVDVDISVVVKLLRVGIEGLL